MIRAFMDCSSGHLSPDTWIWLDARFADDSLRDPTNTVASQLAGGPTRYGWFVYAPEDPAVDIPEDLLRVCQLARQHGAEYVLFDSDAVLDPGLPVLHPGFTEAG